MNSINVDGVHMQMCQDCGRYHLNIQSCKATLLGIPLLGTLVEERPVVNEESKKCHKQ